MAVFYLDPFMMEGEEGGEPTGITIQYWKTWLAPKMDYTLEVLGPYPIKRAEKMLENGEVDVVSQLTKIPERESVFLYPETPLTHIISCIAVTTESPITSADSAEIFYGKKIGFIESAFIPDMLKNSNITMGLISTDDYRKINLNKLFAKRVDALLDINYVSFVYYLKKYGYYNRVKLLLLPSEHTEVFSIFQQNDKGKKLALLYDKANREGIKQGVFDRIVEDFYEKYMPEQQ